MTGFSPREVRRKSTTLVHGGTSLKLSEGGESPVLEAHPGSPVNITGRRPSLTASMAVQRLYLGSEAELEKFERSQRLSGKKEEAIKRDGVAVNGCCPVGTRIREEKETKPTYRRVGPPQPFFIPAKVPEQEEAQSPKTAIDNSLPAPMANEPNLPIVDASVESTAMDFDFEEDNGTWISAHPIAHESRMSVATTTTATSTLIEDRYSHGTLTLDTSVASSAASMMSSAASIQSATTTNSSDVYGWEEELDRKTSFEGRMAWERELARRLPSGGRTMGPRLRGVHEYQFKRAGTDGGKRKSLLYRVLNLSGSRDRRGSADDIAMSGTGTSTPVNEFAVPTSAT
jgi:hypothetical protein